MRILHEAWDDCGEPVGFVYRNLNKNCWSIRINGLVAIHAEHVILKEAQFKVSEAGRQRVLKEKRKNVHAGVQGRLHYVAALDIRHPVLGIKAHTPQHQGWMQLLDGEKVSYNPYKGPHFYRPDDGTSVHDTQHGEFVELDALRRVFIGRNVV